MSIKVVKFGGSSLADAEHFRKVAAIVKADPTRRYVVPSAPGKRFSDDIKVTDMLYTCYQMIREKKSMQEVDEYYKILPNVMTASFASSDLILIFRANTITSRTPCCTAPAEISLQAAANTSRA